MLVLGIETTCDETGVSVVQDGHLILSNLVASQEEIHAIHGGVIPELASRQHVEVIDSLTTSALNKASIRAEELDLIAVAEGPGLIGALLVGINFAKGLSLSLGVPLVGVNHVQAHLYAAIMEKEPIYPALGVVISGGHTALLLINGLEMKLIGQTQDDAIGEAFDKVAKILGLSYPGGPNIEKLARNGDPSRYPFRGGIVKGRSLDFSFSGLKTSVLYQIKGQNGSKDSPLLISEEDKKHVAASFQHAAFSDLVKKIGKAAGQFNCKSVLIGGGVSQNLYLRNMLEKEISLPLFLPAKDLCLDNAAMIAGLGYWNYTKNPQVTNLEAKTRIPFVELSDAEKASLSFSPVGTSPS